MIKLMIKRSVLMAVVLMLSALPVVAEEVDTLIAEEAGTLEASVQLPGIGPLRTRIMTAVAEDVTTKQDSIIERLSDAGRQLGELETIRQRTREHKGYMEEAISAGNLENATNHFGHVKEYAGEFATELKKSIGANLFAQGMVTIGERVLARQENIIERLSSRGLDVNSLEGIHSSAGEVHALVAAEVEAGATLADVNEQAKEFRQQNREFVSEVKALIEGAREERLLEAIDKRIERYERVVDKLEDRGFPVSELRDLISEAKSLRQDLAQALGEDGNKIAVLEDLADVRRDFIETARELVAERIGEGVLTALDKWLNHQEKIIEKLSARGHDVTRLEEINSDMKAKKTELEQAIQAKEEAKTVLRQVRELNKQFITEARALVESTAQEGEQ